MRTKRQIRPPQKLSDSDYSVNNTKSQKIVSKKGVAKDVMQNGKIMGEGDNREGNNRNFNESEAIVNETEEGEKCEETESVGSKVVENATVNEKVQEVCGSDAEVQENSMEQAKEQGDLEKSDKQNVDGKEEKAEDQMLKKDNRSGDKTYAKATTVMDSMTADMCRLGIGRIGFARVLVEVSAKKCIPELIEMVYRDRDKNEVCRKVVKVMTEWYPPRCAECNVFGHTENNCSKHVNIEVVDVEKMAKGDDKGKENVIENTDKEGFEEIKYKKLNGGNKNKTNYAKPNMQFQKKGDVMNKNKNTGQFAYQRKNKDDNGVNMEKMKSPMKEQNLNNLQSSVKKLSPLKVNTTHASDPQCSSGSGNIKKAWNVRGEILEALRRSANKYSVLDTDNVEDGVINEENDVYKDENGIAQCMEKDTIEGGDKEVLT
ncbi:ATPase, F1/V1/A1 complex, alpha/beta subunit, Zinc knuckle CX2CX4HX4C [Artemisia annua]|uniref:ATPase, F1/V1/A1 complex, alpha/beta subunit, Zinc knuckle CX2CX4HX4C n=1 Tax=Artemisia annua TaxID=35608 RepID=A0A2U1QFY8_ARTAN|nr:ATPase, F1/V1/A1 complex, alpha/beta subunit, Zinc knuckle CX2CX4HX4C [Artemisia annua]